MRFAFKNTLSAMMFEHKFAETIGSLVEAFVARSRALTSVAWWPTPTARASTSGRSHCRPEATIADGNRCRPPSGAGCRCTLG